MKFTKEFMQKIKQQYQNYGEDFNPDFKISDFLNEHDSLKFDEGFENNNDIIEFIALSLAVMREKPNDRGRILLGITRMGFDFDSQRNFFKLIENLDNIDSIEEMDGGNPTFSTEEEIDNDSIDLDSNLDNSHSYTVNDIFNYRTMQEAEDNMKSDEFDNERIGKSLVNYEKNPENKISIYSAVNLKLDNLTKDPITSENLRNKQHEAAELLSIYAALQKRSERRTFVDILKHPFKTFGEWLVKGKVKDTLKECYGINDKQLDSMTGLVKDKLVTGKYKGVNENGEVQLKASSLNLDDSISERESVDKNIIDEEVVDFKDNNVEEKLNYDQLSQDSSFDYEADSKSQFQEDIQVDDPNKSMSDI